MKDLLLPSHRAALARFVGSAAAPRRVLLAFDYDGVLAPLVKRPSGAWMRPSTRVLLHRLARLYPVAVVSGRDYRSVTRFLGGLDAPLRGAAEVRGHAPSPAPLRGAAEVRGHAPSPAPLRGAAEVRGHAPSPAPLRGAAEVRGHAPSPAPLRGAAEVRGHVTVVGNHGFDLGRPVPVPAAVLRKVRAWRRRLEQDLAGVDGVYFEDKRSTLAVHYGLEDGRREAERAVYEAANQLEGTRLIPGKKVLNVLPHDFPSKGDAVRTLVARLGCDGAVVLGDDVTDEDAFAVGPPLVMGIHVGDGPSLAPWRLRSQPDVDRLMRLLVSLRAPGGAR